MKPKQTPDEYSSVCAYQMVDDISGQLEFLKAVFQAETGIKVSKQV